MVNVVTKNANFEILFPTLDVYKEKYSLMLKYYLFEYKDNTEKRFIELQIEHYKTYCDETLNNPNNTFNKWNLEKFYTSRLLVIEYLELKLKEFKHYNNDLSDLKLPINKEARELFEWLVEYYRPNQKKSIKFINILYYLKNDVDKDIYTFSLIQEDYTAMILKKFEIEIKKYDKSAKYKENEKPILNKIEREFRNSRGKN